MILALVAIACLTACSEASVVNRQSKLCPDECKGLPLDISFVVDASVSIRPANFTTGLWFVQNFVDKFNIAPDQVRVSMVTYADRVYTEDAFDYNAFDNKRDLNAAIIAIPYRFGNSTETGAGIRYMLENQVTQARPGVRTVIIVLTDGNSQEPNVTKAEADRALNASYEVFAIGVGHDVSEQELHNIASDGKHVFIVGNYGMLDDILERLAFETCGVTPEPDCVYDPIDITFVIDSSVSIGKGNFTVGLEFIKEFIEVFEINPSSTRVAAIMYGDRVYSESAIPFDAFGTKKSTIDALMGLEWMHGTATETGMGIDYMVDNFLPNTRSHAANIAIIITDGGSRNSRKTAASAAMARQKGFTTFAVGVGVIGEVLSQKELNDIAGDPSRVLTAQDYARLNTIRNDLINITCTGIEAQLKEERGTFK